MRARNRPYDPGLMTVTQAAESSGVPEGFIAARIHLNQLPHIRLSAGSVRIQPGDLQYIIETYRVHQAQESPGGIARITIELSALTSEVRSLRQEIADMRELVTKRVRPRPIIPAIQREYIFKRDKNTCRYCGKRLKVNDRTIDHIIPINRGGSHEHENLAACCNTCNSSKRDSLPSEKGMTLLPIPS